MIDTIHSVSEYLMGTGFGVAGLAFVGMPFESTGELPGTLLFVGLGLIIWGFGVACLAEAAMDESADTGDARDEPDEEPVAYGQA